MSLTRSGRVPLVVRASGSGRVVALDVVRGFALCGILVANVKPIAHRGGTAALPAAGTPSRGAGWVHLLVDQRFFPLFSLLFGIGFSLLLQQATARSPRPRLLLVRRLVALLAAGVVHFALLWRGDVLTVYAVVGLVVLLPSSWLPRVVVAVLGAVLVAVSVAFLGGWYSLVPGLFLVGSALTRYGVVSRLQQPGRFVVLVWAVCALAAVPLLVLQARPDDAGPASNVVYPLAGLVLAGVYAGGLVLLLRTPLRRVLVAVFVPLGRTALTNYLGATVAVLALARLADDPETWSTADVLAIAAGVLAVQWVAAMIWLRRFRQGPLEWGWRWVTWGQRPPMRRDRSCGRSAASCFPG